MFGKMRVALWALPIILGLAANASAQPLGDTATPIKIAINEWTGQNLTAHIAGTVLEKLGYKVEYVTAGTLPQFTGIASGVISASPEVWPSNLGDVYPKAKAAGQLQEIGELGLDSRDGWIYTPDTKAVCPGLPDWSALKNPACVQALATPDSFPNGRLLDYPADWGSVSGVELKNFNIPFTPIPAGSEGAMVAELQSAIAEHKPLLMRFWAPHWVLAQTKVEWLKMPPCDPKDLNSCIVAPPVLKVVWSGFEQKWPAGYSIMKSLQVHAEDQQNLIFAVDKQGKTLDQAVAQWMDQHQSDWQGWVKAAQN
jgi:glycine betaine/proline transport system substrate-binding protein